MTIDNRIESKIDGNGNVVIQDVSGSTITVNMNNSEEVSKALVDFNDRLSQLPLKILKLMEDKRNKEVPIIGANIYLSNYAIISPIPGDKIRKSIGVTITNLTKDIRYFNKPFYKTSIPFEDSGIDTFILTDPVERIDFPYRLEYGQPVSVHHYFIPSSNDMFRGIIEKDPEATIVAVVTTTLGETYYSNEIKIKKLLEK